MENRFNILLIMDLTFSLHHFIIPNQNQGESLSQWFLFSNNPGFRTKLSEVGRKDRFLGQTDLYQALDSLSWANLIVSHIQLHPDMESENMNLQLEATEHFKVSTLTQYDG